MIGRIFCALVVLMAVTVVDAPSCAAASYKMLKKQVFADADGDRLSFDVMVPTGKANGLGLIDVARGAGYTPATSISDAEIARIAETFCSRGYTLFVVYPGATTKYKLLEMTDHVNQAIVYLKEHASDYQVDPDRLGLMSTAGGVHLVALVAITASDQTAVRAAGVYYPPTDFRDKGARDLYIQANQSGWEQLRSQALGGRSVQDTGAAADVTNQRDPRIKMPQVSPKAPPLLVIRGDADPIEPTTGRSNLLLTAMREADRATDMVVKRPGRDPARTTEAELRTLADWFDKRLTAE